MRPFFFISLACFFSCVPIPPPRSGGPSVPADRVARVRPLVKQSASRHGLPPELVLAVIQIESSFNPEARSPMGARGLMQLMPATAASLAQKLSYESYDIEDPAFNIEAGTYYLAYLLQMFHGDLRLALAGYNNGPERIGRWLKQGQPLPANAERYIAAVLNARETFLHQPSHGPAGTVAKKENSPASPSDDLDQNGLRQLLHQQEALYGHRPNEPLPSLDATSTPSLP